MGLNPSLPESGLRHALTREPDWIDGRKKWLRTGWPQHKATTKADFELFALVRAKAHLAVGSKIPDGSASEMSEVLGRLLPELIAKPEVDPSIYQSWRLTVTIDNEGRTSCGWQIAREGQSLPRANEDIGNKSAFELFLFAQVRIAIQSEIEIRTR